MIEASSVITNCTDLFSECAYREASPSRAWRMRHYRMRAVVVACVAALVPRIHVRQTEVTAAFRDVEGGYHLVTLPACSAIRSATAASWIASASMAEARRVSLCRMRTASNSSATSSASTP